MSRVSEQTPGMLRPLKGGGLFRALLAVALLAGPGFFTFALFTALYRDVPPNSPGPHGVGVLAANSDRMDGSLLSPVAERIVTAPNQTSQNDGVGRAPGNPVTTYLNITGTTNYSALPASTAASENTSKATFRTVCVRLCDGSYFPIGYATTPREFSAHEAQCQSRCGSPARLYVYANGSESALQMRNLSGHSYLELETAFRFHAKYDAQCSCRSQPWTLASQERHQRYAQLTAVEAKSPQVQSRTAVAHRITPVELSGVATTATIAAVDAAQTVGDHAPSGALTSPTNMPAMTVRVATKSEIAKLDAERPKADRIAAVLERTEFIAALDLASMRTATASPSGQRHQLAAAREPKKPNPFSFVSFAPPASLSNKTKSTEIAVAELTGIPGGRGQLSATDILMRNLNPHY